MSIIRETITAIRATIVLWILTALIYPFFLIAIGQVAFPYQANGSLITNQQGQVVGSALIGQPFTGDRYFIPQIKVVEQRFVHDGNIWSSGGVSAGMDMMLAFIAHSFSIDVAADIQLYAEYFPATTIYGRPFERKNVSEYIRELS